MSAPSTIFKWPIDEFSKVATRDGPVKILKGKNFRVKGTDAAFYFSWSQSVKEKKIIWHSIWCLKNLKGRQKLRLRLHFG
jgi:hypothetical protein